MGIFSSSKSWSAQGRTQDRDRRAGQKAKHRRTAKLRADNRRHMLEHPARHLFGSIFR
jgi:hypothetical protein